MKFPRGREVAFGVLVLCLFFTFFCWNYSRHHPVSEAHILIAGLLFGFLLFGILYAFAALQSRSMDVAEQERVRLAAFPEENPNPVIEIDGTGAISYVNPASKEKFPDLLKQGFRHPILQGLIPAVAEMEKGGLLTLKRDVAVGDSIFEEIVSIVPESRLVWVYVNDITERKRFEKQRQEQAQVLEKANQEMVRQQQILQALLDDLQTSKTELEERRSQLEASNKHLNELLVMKDEFVAKVSHELRTPLTAVKEGVRLFLDGVLGTFNEEQNDFLSTIDQSVDRLAELINNLLDFSKLQAGRLRLSRRRASISELVDMTLKSYRLIAGGRVIGSQCSAVPDAFVDSNRILQVLGNLFANAIKFTKEDGSITFLLRAYDDDQVVVSVKDNGAGIAKEDLQKLFQKFSQVGDDTSQRRGTGLGLALCKELVEMHGGKIWVESEPGRGSVFQFTLPVYTSELALEKGFEQMLTSNNRSELETIGLILIGVGAVCGPLQSAQGWDPRMCLEQLALAVRQHVKRGDHVLEIEPDKVAILTMANTAGIGVILERLRKVLPEWLAGKGVNAPAVSSLGFGLAVYPTDGMEVKELVAKAGSVLREKQKVSG